VTAHQYGAFFGGDENILELDSNDNCKTVNKLKTTNFDFLRG